MVNQVFKTFRQKRDLTQGSLSKNLMILALPLIMGNLFQTLFNLVDMFWVGKLGKVAIASVAMGGTVLMLIMIFIGGLSVGTVALISRCIGAKEVGKAQEAAMQSLIMAVMGSIILAGVGAFLSHDLLRILGADSEVMKEGAPYLSILLIGSISMFFMFIFTGILQGAGDTLTPTLVLAVSTIINIILDPFMIFGIGFFPRMGVAGAAWATLIAQLAGVAISIEVLLKGRSHIRLSLSDIRIDREIIFRIIKIGIPASLQMGIRSLTYAVLMVIVAAFGTAAVAAYGIGMRLSMLMLMPAFGFGAAASTLVGQNLGAKNPSRAAQSGWMATGYQMLILIALGIPGFIYAEQVIGFFNNSADVVSIGAVFMRYTIVGLLFMPMGLVLGRALGGAGDTVAPMILTAVALIGIQIPLAIWLPHVFSLGIIGVWIATVIAAMILGISTAVWYGMGRWKLKKV